MTVSKKNLGFPTFSWGTEINPPFLQISDDDGHKNPAGNLNFPRVLVVVTFRYFVNRASWSVRTLIFICAPPKFTSSGGNICSLYSIVFHGTEFRLSPVYRRRSAELESPIQSFVEFKWTGPLSLQNERQEGLRRRRTASGNHERTCSLFRKKGKIFPKCRTAGCPLAFKIVPPTPADVYMQVQVNV